MNSSLLRITVFAALLYIVFGNHAPVHATGFGWFLDDLPPDERAALIELEEGFFDSASWDKLHSFYVQPLSVPLGELRYLRDIVPDLPNDLPIRPDVLAGYEPWTQELVRIFFKDYPYLVPFKSLVSFETDTRTTFAQMAFTSRLSGFSSMFHQSMRFTVAPVKQMRADGTIYFEDSFARWRRRRLLLTLPFLGKMQIGNFSFSMNRGLFYGYFPNSSASQDSVKYNWLYGASRTWNGVSTRTPAGKKVTIQTLVHRRQTETVAGLKTEFTPNTFFSVYGAFSGSLMKKESGGSDTSLAVHGGMSGSIDQFSLSLETGSDLLHPESVPVYLTLSHGSRQEKRSLSFIRIPAHFSAPRSSLLRSFYSRLEIDSIATGDLAGVALSFSDSFLEFYKQTFSASYISMGRKADLKTSYSFRGSRPFDYLLYYSLNADNHLRKMKHRFKVSGDIQAVPFFGVASTVSYDVTTETYWRIRAFLQAKFKLFSALFISPFGTFNTDSNGQKSGAVGVGEHMVFFKRSFGEVKFTFPVVSPYGEKYSLYAKVNFLF